MKVGQNTLSAAILAASLSPALSAAPRGVGLDLNSASAIPALENTLVNSRIAMSAPDQGTMRDRAMQSFEGLMPERSGAAPVVLGQPADERGKELSAGALPETTGGEAGKTPSSAAKEGKTGLSSKVPALAKGGHEDSGNMAGIYVEKGLKYAGIAAVAAVIVGGTVAGAVLLGNPAIGVVVGVAVLGVLAHNALHSFWNKF